jgi:hypothetical protein
MHTPPSDVGQFYGIRTWKQTPTWWREPWDEFPPGFVEDAVASKRSGRTTPIEVSHRLAQLAKVTLSSLEKAKATIADPHEPEFLATQLDLSVHANLAQYHAEKTLAAMHLGFFQATGEAGRLLDAKDHMESALAAWRRIADATTGVYHDNLVLGHAKGTKRSRAGHHHGGHWKDRLPEIESDVEFLHGQLKQHHPAAKSYRRFPAETQRKQWRPITHNPVTTISPGQVLSIQAKVPSAIPIESVRLRFRPLNQTVDWQEMTMQPLADGRFESVIPADKIPADYDFQYYFEAIGKDFTVNWPRWQDGQPYYVVKLQLSRD